MKKPTCVVAVFVLLSNSAFSQTINVLSATYGSNVNAVLAANNATADVKAACDGKQYCDYVIDWHIIGDPFGGSMKDYRVVYNCGTGGQHQGYVAPEAGVGKVVSLRC